MHPPVSLTSLVGREQEIKDLDTLIAAKRLVTLTGVGGTGKTRLAAELGLRLEWKRENSVAWVHLGACNDPALVPQHVAATLSLRVTREGGTMDALIDAIRDREMLLVLDDCEHLICACAELAATLLTRCPMLRILATSREPLGVAGEHVWPVPPIAQQEAIQLFDERAAAALPDYVSSDDNRAAVAEVCTRLDRIPLAIELAAARIRVLTPAQIASKLEDRFAILTGGARNAVARHRTLRAAIDWSFDLLSPREQTLLTRLSVFPGSFSLEMAEEVCDAELDLMTGLVEKSLLVTIRRRAAVRYGMLETIRQYAAEKLAASGEADALRRRHALACLEMARASGVDPMGPIMSHLDSLDLEHDNVRAALSWSIEHEPDAIALPLGAAFRWYWYYRIMWTEGLQWLARVLEKASPELSRDRAAAVAGGGTYAAYISDIATGRRWLEDAEAMWRELGDERELALTLSALAQTLANAQQLDDAWSRAVEAVALARKRGTPWDVAYCLTNAIAFVAQRLDDLEAADQALEEAQSIWAPMKHPLGLPFVLTARAVVALRRRDADAAARFARAALTEARSAHEYWFGARALRILAFTADADSDRAARLVGAADAALRSIGARMLMHEKSEHERLMKSLAERMPADDLETALREGAAMSFEEACDLALQRVEAELPADAPRLEVRDLGPLQIIVGGKPLASDGRASNRARELLVFLLAHPPGPTKEEVGVAFWPDSTTEQVKNSFHVTLHRLRKLLGGSETIVADGARYRVAMPVEIQSRRFEQDLTSALRRPDPGVLERALSLYCGDFLQGEESGEWSLPIRSRLKQLYVRGVFTLAQAYETRQRFQDAADAYTRVLSRDPFHEAAARQLMICRTRLGARSDALLVYRELEQRLRDDLQATPEPATASLYKRLRANESV